MNESKLEEKKQLGFTKEILDYLKKNPSVAIAVVSAAITIMSILSSYAGRLANITFLKYWGIDSSYAKRKCSVSCGQFRYMDRSNLEHKHTSSKCVYSHLS